MQVAFWVLSFTMTTPFPWALTQKVLPVATNPRRGVLSPLMVENLPPASRPSRQTRTPVSVPLPVLPLAIVPTLPENTSRVTPIIGVAAVPTEQSILFEVLV